MKSLCRAPAAGRGRVPAGRRNPLEEPLCPSAPRWRYVVAIDVGMASGLKSFPDQALWRGEAFLHSQNEVGEPAQIPLEIPGSLGVSASWKLARGWLSRAATHSCLAATILPEDGLADGGHVQKGGEQ